MQKLTEANMYLYRSGVERTCTRDFFVPEGSQRCARVLGKRGLFVNLVGVANRLCVGNRKYVGTTFEIGKQGAKNVRNWEKLFFGTNWKKPCNYCRPESLRTESRRNWN